MAKPYPILPAYILDELHGLNCALGTYQFMVESSIRRMCTEGTPTDFESFLHGLDDIFKPLLEGFQGIESQAIAFREMGVVGFCQLGESDQE